MQGNSGFLMACLAWIMGVGDRLAPSGRVLERGHLLGPKPNKCWETPESHATTKHGDVGVPRNMYFGLENCIF